MSTESIPENTILGDIVIDNDGAAAAIDDTATDGAAVAAPAPVASDPVEDDETDCFACCLSFNKSTRKRIRCDAIECNFPVCKTCVRTYLTSTASDPHCMNCKKAWGQKFLVTNLNQSWFSKEYKQHRQKFLTDQQIAKLPESMNAAIAYNQSASLENESNKLQEEIRAIEKVVREKREQHRALRRRIYQIRRGNGSDAKNQTKFMMPCPVDDCRGLLSTAYKCELCKTYACPKCLIPTGAIRDDPTHVCNEDDVKTAALIRESTKPCPGCGERIYKVSGCDQMWCTKCHTTFSWKTGSIITNAHVHNPHFFEWQRKNGGNVARNPGDVICGGLQAYYTFSRAIQTIIINAKTSKMHEKNIIKDFYHKLHRFASIISYHDLERQRNIVRNSSNFEMERIRYINKEITRENFSKLIISKDRTRKRALEKLHIYETIDAVLIDLVSYIINNKNLPEEAGYMMLLTKKQEMILFAQYCNKQLQEVSFVQNCTVYQIDPETWNTNKQKFSAKQIGL